MSHEFKDLVGKKIIEIHMGSEHSEIVFTADDGSRLRYDAEGDCCSSSWFEHISGIDNLIGHVVTSTEDISLDSIAPTPGGEDDYIQQYGFRISTDKGYFEIEMRNESNGYYGGSVSHHPISSVLGLSLIKEDF